MAEKKIRLRVLLSAYGCQPGKGSEFGVGWNQVQQSSRFNDVWVITRSAHRKAIEGDLRGRTGSNTQWVYFDLPGCARLWRNSALIRMYYYLWQLGAYFVARRLHNRIHFDVAHHVTFVKYSSPTFLAFLPIPFIWGPVGGGDSAPSAFRKWFGARGRIFEILRDVSQCFGEKDPLVQLAARRTALALATTQETEKRLLRMGCRKVAIMSEAGLSARELTELGSIPLPEPQRRPLRIITVGRVLYWKGYEFALRAFAKFHQRFPDSEYWILGEGADRLRMEQLSRSLGVSANVFFSGQMSRADVFDKIAVSDIMLFPSLHDSGGWVCLEAMASGRPVVCLDLGGPGLQVTSEVGIKVPALTPVQAIADLAHALELLAADHQLRIRLGKSGRARVAQCFHWDIKGQDFAALYSRVAASRSGTAGRHLASTQFMATDPLNRELMTASSDVVQAALPS